MMHNKAESRPAGFLMVFLLLLGSLASAASNRLQADAALGASDTKYSVPASSPAGIFELIQSPALLDAPPPASVAQPPAAGVSLCLVRTPGDAFSRAASRIARPVRLLGPVALSWVPRAAVPEYLDRVPGAIVLCKRRPDRLYAIVYRARDSIAPSKTRGGELSSESSRLRPALETIARVLWSDSALAVIEYDPLQSEELHVSYTALPVGDRPIRWERATPLAARGRELPAGAADPAVARLVAGVDSTRLEGTIRFLQDFRSRRTTENACAVAGDSIASRLRGYGLEEISRFDYNPGWSPNVVSVKRGVVAPEECYVICGHYDSISRSAAAPGADDNASGTAAVLEAARLFAGQTFEATVYFIAWSGEEQGLVGSREWTAWASDAGLDIRGAVNLDMIGWRGAPGSAMTVIGDARFQEAQTAALEAAATYLPGFDAVAGAFSGGNSDQQSFWDEGYPAVSFYEGTGNPHWHQPDDLLGISVNDLSLVRRSTQAAVALLATWVRPVAVRITHEPITEARSSAGGYEVRARITARDALEPESLLVRYAVDGEMRPPLRLLPSDGEGEYAALIPRQDPGRLVEYEIRARDQAGRVATWPAGGRAEWLRFVIGLQPVFEDDFAAERGWTVGASEDNAVSGLWERGRPTGTGAQPGEGDSGAPSDMAGEGASSDTTGSCFFTGNGASGDPGEADVDGGRTTLTSPRFAAPGALAFTVSYSRWFVDETSPDDTLSVFLSNDDGAHWLPLERVTQSERAWKRVRFDSVQEQIAPSDRMRLRFVVEDAARPSLLEAALDQVRIEAVWPRPDAGNAARVLALSPNPVRERTVILLREGGPGRPELDLFDAGGRRLAHPRPQWSGSEDLAAVWEPRDEAGARLPAGVYFLRARSRSGASAWTRVVVIR